MALDTVATSTCLGMKWEVGEVSSARVGEHVSPGQDKGPALHELRREFGSLLRETPRIFDHEMRDWLGHANITTTSRYLSTTRVGLQQALHKFEEARNIRTKFAQTNSVVPNGQPESADTKALKPLDYSG